MLLVVVGLAEAACKGGPSSPAPTPTPDPNTPAPTPPASSVSPVLSVPVVDLTLLNDFLPFGYSSAGHSNPTYELRTNGESMPVRAAGPGTVVNVLNNPEGDLELHVRPPDTSDYVVVYDHVVELQVTVGQAVAAGQVLGRIGRFVPGTGRTELQINKGQNQGAVALCPRQFGTAEFNAAHDAALSHFPGRGASVCLADSVIP